jgi:hypothetical protein
MGGATKPSTTKRDTKTKDFRQKQKVFGQPFPEGGPTDPASGGSRGWSHQTQQSESRKKKQRISDKNGRFLDKGFCAKRRWGNRDGWSTQTQHNESR